MEKSHFPLEWFAGENVYAGNNATVQTEGTSGSSSFRPSVVVEAGLNNYASEYVTPSPATVAYATLAR